MNVKKLLFFDKDGYNYNFNWDSSNEYWEGTIYLPKVSVGLYANGTIYILEQVGSSYVFPQEDETNDKLVFKWDTLNKFVDEFFMFNFDDTYVIQDTSALTYTPNDGPDCETLIVNRFDEYEVDLDSTSLEKALPVHIAFMANERYDATTYARTLFIYCNGKVIARIKFLAETVEEDERLKIWNDNLGYKITPEDALIFKTSDIKEYMPDYQLLNEKRKELMLEGSNIYPYIGSYRAIINAIKFFGYNNLSIIEYWKNVNPSDINFGKIYHSSKYSLTKKETLRVGARTIVLPNKDYKKINQLALVYTINHPTGEVDEWELPKVKEDFTYTIEEALIKLFALRKKLNKEFMPGTSRIIDIIGEGNYFGLIGLTKTNMTCHIEKYDTTLKPAYESNVGKYIHLTDDRYFERYIIEKEGYSPELENSSEYKLNQFNVISDIADKTINELSGTKVDLSTKSYPENDRLCQLYKDYYNEVFVDHTRIEHYDDTDVDDTYAPSSAKLVLTNKTYGNSTFGGSEITFGYSLDTYTIRVNESTPDDKAEERKERLVSLRKLISEKGMEEGYNEWLNQGSISKTNQVYNIINTIEWGDCNGDCNHNCDSDCGCNHITFDNVNTFGHESTTWTIKMSDNQYDSDLKEVGVERQYVKRDGDKDKWEYEGEEVFVQLPYIGYYDVVLTIDDTTKTFTRSIKVEPYNIEIKGFYYDARKLPSNIITNTDTAYNDFVLGILQKMTAWAVAERTSSNFENEKGVDFSMPTYTATGEIVHNGPYVEREREEWSVMDNVNEEITHLYPLVKYARYIKNGVDVKPYTWFLLGYEYSRIAGMQEPVWTIVNNGTGDEQKYEGNYLTFLLKKEGNYTIKLTLKDSNGNVYEVSRNIFVVSYGADYKLYQSLKNDYDFLVEQKQLGEIHGQETSGEDDGDMDGGTTKKLSFTTHTTHYIEVDDTDVIGVNDENNIGWELQTNATYDWLFYTPLIGKGNQTITISVADSSVKKTRSAVLYLNDWEHNTMDYVKIVNKVKDGDSGSDSDSDSGSESTGTLKFGSDNKTLIMTEQEDGSGLVSIEIKNPSNIEYAIVPSVDWVSYEINSKTGKLEISCDDFKAHKGETFSVYLKDKYGNITDSRTVIVGKLDEDTTPWISWATPPTLRYYGGRYFASIASKYITDLEITVGEGDMDLSPYFNRSIGELILFYDENLTTEIRTRKLIFTGTRIDTGKRFVIQTYDIYQAAAPEIDEDKPTVIFNFNNPYPATAQEFDTPITILNMTDISLKYDNGEFNGLSVELSKSNDSLHIKFDANDISDQRTTFIEIVGKDKDGKECTEGHILIQEGIRVEPSITFGSTNLNLNYYASTATNSLSAIGLTGLVANIAENTDNIDLEASVSDTGDAVNITYGDNPDATSKTATIKVSGTRTDNNEELSNTFTVTQEGKPEEASLEFNSSNVSLTYYANTTTNTFTFKNLTNLVVSGVENTDNIKDLAASISDTSDAVNITYGDNLTENKKSATITISGTKTDKTTITKSFTVEQNGLTTWYFEDKSITMRRQSNTWIGETVVVKDSKIQGCIAFDDNIKDSWGITTSWDSTMEGKIGIAFYIENNDHLGQSFNAYLTDSEGNKKSTLVVNIPKLDPSLTFENDTITVAYDATSATNSLTATNLTGLTVSVEDGYTFDSITPTLTDNTISMTFTKNTTTEERSATIKVSGKRDDNGEDYSKTFTIKQSITTEPSITLGYTDLDLNYYGTTTTNDLSYKNLTNVTANVVENSGNIKDLKVSISTNNNAVNITYGDNLGTTKKTAIIKVSGTRTDNGETYDITFNVTQAYTTGVWWFGLYYDNQNADINLSLSLSSTGSYSAEYMINKPYGFTGTVECDNKYKDWGIYLAVGGIEKVSISKDTSIGNLVYINNSNHMGESFEIYAKDSEGTIRATCKVNIPSSTS